MFIRRVTEDEAEALWALRIRAVSEHPRHFGSSAEEDAALPIDEVRRRIAAAPILGAFDDSGSIVAMAGIYLDSRQKQRHRGHVWGVYVAPEVRGRGVGRRLMLAIIDAARALRAVELLQLTVSTPAIEALALYESLGFRIYGTEERALKIDGEYVDEHYMVLMLRT
jgi:ribosomal protein S18 acetylase RimI-like enzyme